MSLAGRETSGGKRRLPFRDAGRLQGVNELLDDLIGGRPRSHPQDGAIFRNAAGTLPARPAGEYREYTVSTRGVSGRGARRLVVAVGGEVFYTDDHYRSFIKIDPRRHP